MVRTLVQRRRDTYRELDHPADLLLEITEPPRLVIRERAHRLLRPSDRSLWGKLRREALIEVREPSMAEACELCWRRRCIGSRLRASGCQCGGDNRKSPARVRQTMPAHAEAVHVSARLRGNVIDKNRHVLFTEIKAVTYHRLEGFNCER